MAGTTLLATSALATTIYPIHRATILCGQTFDLKVEFDGLVAPGDVSVTINGVEHAEFFGQDADLIERVEGSTLRPCACTIRRSPRPAKMS